MSTKLNKGDIIIFKAEDDWLSKSIAWLTNSDVSHAAMVYSENSIIEIGIRGIGIHKVNTSNGRGAYIMRLKAEVDAEPLIQSADKYYRSKIQYDFPALFLLAGLLVRKKFNPTTRLLSITNRILSSACLELDKYMQKVILHHGERDMVCSQLVYQIFYDCGGSYQIQIKQKKKFSLLAVNHSSAICLEELAENLPENNSLKQPLSNHLPELDNTVINSEAKELYTALCESEKAVAALGNDFSQSIPDLQEGALNARKFLDKTKELLSLAGSDFPMDAMFVTPADLAYHTSNLKLQGQIGITREPFSD